MNKTEIEWCDRTWNPITGCLSDCLYCYAKKQARRFEGYDSCHNANFYFDHGSYEISKPMYRTVVKQNEPNKKMKAPYPFGFAPTFHQCRLSEPQKTKSSQNVFVGSMTDIFGNWVKDDWIKSVFNACEKAPQHRYLFLTKNPVGLPLSSYLFNGVFGNHADNYWFGITVTNQKSLQAHYKHFSNISGNTFLSIEPLHEPIDLSHIDVGDVIYDIPKGRAYYYGGGQGFIRPKWVIVGAETGNRKNKITPMREWIQDIVNACRNAGIPIFLKNNLSKIWGEPLLQEFPWEVVE